jgi:C4-type Zn-finger protein
MEKVCPICGSNKYTAIKENNKIDGPEFKEWIIYYKCDGCSIHFSDCDKFLVDKKEKYKPDPFNVRLLYGIGI